MDEEDDEEDIGLADLKDSSSSADNLNFDDEAVKPSTETGDLISLDDLGAGGIKQRKNVPKLKGPKK